MTVILNLDLRNTQADTGAEPVPAGWYVAMIDESSLVPTKSDPNNKMLKLRFNIVEGQFAGRKIFEQFNIIHSNVMTQEIAQKQLKAVCVAAGHHGMLADSGELHGKPMRVKVKVRKATDEYEASNAISSFLNMSAPLPAGATTAVAQAAPAAAPAAFAAQPWAAAAPAAAMPPATTGAPVFPAAAPAAAAAPAPAALPWASAPAGVAPAPAAAAPAPVPAAAPAPVPAAAPAEPIKRMTEKAAGATYEQFVANKWTDEAMIKEGYMVLENQAPVAAPVAPPAAPAAPAAPAVPASPPVTTPAAPAGTPMTPPWATPAA